MRRVLDAVIKYRGNYPKDYYMAIECKGCTINYDEFIKCVDMLIGDPLKLIIWKESKSSKPATLSTIYKPKIGEKCLMNYPDIDDAWYEYTIDYIGKFVLVASCDDITERQAHIDDVNFKPLPKLIDGKAYQFEYVNNKTIYCGIYNSQNDRFLHLHGHVMASYCK